MTDTSPSRDPEAILAAIRSKTQVLLRLRKQRDAGKFTGMGAALGLQRIENELKQLRAGLPPLTLVN